MTEQPVSVLMAISGAELLIGFEFSPWLDWVGQCGVGSEGSLPKHNARASVSCCCLVLAKMFDMVLVFVCDYLILLSAVSIQLFGGLHPPVYCRPAFYTSFSPNSTPEGEAL